MLLKLVRQVDGIRTGKEAKAIHESDLTILLLHHQLLNYINFDLAYFAESSVIRDKDRRSWLFKRKA